MTLPNFFKEFLSNSSERIKNPLIGAFTTSWLIFNWKAVFIILFSTLTINERIDFVTLSYSSNSFLIYYPLITSLFYVVILPYLMWGLDIISNKALLERKNNLHKTLIHDLINRQQAVKQEVILEELKSDQKEKAQLNNSIKSLQEQLSESENHIEVLNNELTNLRSMSKYEDELTFSPEEEALLDKEYRRFTDSDLFEFFENIGTSVSTYQAFPNKINPMVEQKFLHTNILFKNIEEGSVSYDFTKKGRYFWKSFVLSRSVRNRNSRETFEKDDMPF